MGKDKFKVYKNVFDRFTLRTVFKLESLGQFYEHSMVPISIGKEANLFAAVGDMGNVVVKIYRLQSADFNRMYDYIKFDPRFYDIKKQRRKVVFAWGQREYRNLLNAREAEVDAPTPYAIENHVMVMEMIGRNNPAPKLKDKMPKNKEKFFNQIVENVRKFYKSGYVHGDLSHFNILNFNERPVLIDFSQATPLENPTAEEYLERDMKIVCDFFSRNGLNTDLEETLVKIRS